MKKKILLLSILASFAGSALAMELPTGELHQINSQLTQTNQAQFGKKPYFSLNVMQPTPTYKTLNQCVNYLF